jgi:hypothetical protein
MRFLFTMSEIGRPRTDDGERIVPAGLLGLLDAKRFRRPAKLIFRIGRISGFKESQPDGREAFRRSRFKDLIRPPLFASLGLKSP